MANWFRWVSCRVTIGIALLGCSDDPTTVADRERPDLPRWTLSQGPVVQIGVLDGDENYQFFRAGSAVRLGDQTIVVANQGTGHLRYYSPDGVFLTKTAGRGGGPGEFRWLHRIYPVGQARESIMAYDRAGRISFFDGDGGFLGSDNVRIDSHDEFTMDEWLYRRNWIDRIPNDTRRHRVARILDHLPAPVGEPGYRFVRVDDVGNVWVADDIAPGGDRAGWTVYDTTATAVARVVLPPRFEMFEITATTVLGRWRDETDVEFIRIHGLIKQPWTGEVPLPLPAAAAPIFNGDSTLILTDFRSILRNLVTMQESYFADHGRYTADRNALDEWDLPDGVTVDVVAASGTGWKAVVVHPDSPVIGGIAVGGLTPPGWNEGSPKLAQLYLPAEVGEDAAMRIPIPGSGRGR